MEPTWPVLSGPINWCFVVNFLDWARLNSDKVITCLMICNLMCVYTSIVLDYFVKPIPKRKVKYFGHFLMHQTSPAWKRLVLKLTSTSYCLAFRFLFRYHSSKPSPWLSCSALHILINISDFQLVLGWYISKNHKSHPSNSPNVSRSIDAWLDHEWIWSKIAADNSDLNGSSK